MILKLVAAGSTFAGLTLLGLFGGIWIAGRTGEPFWVIGGIFVGLAVGGYSAARMALGEPR